LPAGVKIPAIRTSTGFGKCPLGFIFSLQDFVCVKR
jgi:hypothetical protein